MVSSPDQQPENHGYINQGKHEGDVYFGRVAPPPYHVNAIKCHQCQRHTWRDTPDCVYCGADTKCELERRRLRREIIYIDYKMKRLNLWLIGTVLIILLSFWLDVMWLSAISFLISSFLSVTIGKIQQNKKDLINQLYRLN